MGNVLQVFLNNPPAECVGVVCVNFTVISKMQIFKRRTDGLGLF